MSHIFQLSEEQYAYLLAYAEGIGETPEAIFEYWVDGKIDRMEAHKAVLRKRAEQQTRTSHEEDPSGLTPK